LKQEHSNQCTSADPTANVQPLTLQGERSPDEWQ